METKYVGTRSEEGCKVKKVAEGRDPEILELRLDLWNHSPTGFNWNYAGSGPAQLALALLADATGNDRLAVLLHQDFKREFVSRFPKEAFELGAEEVQKWADLHKGTLDLFEWEDPEEESDQVADPSYTPTAAEALRHPAPFVEGMTETTIRFRARTETLGVKGNRDLVRKLIAVGREFDVGRGGLFEAASGSVQLWCSPEDKPAGWTKPMTRGAFPEPRELVGCLTWQWARDEAVLYIEAYPYELLPDRASNRWDQIPEDTWKGVMVWLKEKAWELVRLAKMHETFLGCGCPFCEFVTPPEEAKVLYDLIGHVTKEHGQVQGISLGERVTITMQDGREVTVRNVTDITH